MQTLPETKLRYLIHILTAKGLWHTSGPVQPSTRYIHTQVIGKSRVFDEKQLMVKLFAQAWCLQKKECEYN